MRSLTKEEKKHLWEEVLMEFPDDETMQEVHYVRLLHYHMTKNLSSEARFQFYNNLGKKQIS